VNGELTIAAGGAFEHLAHAGSDPASQGYWPIGTGLFRSLMAWFEKRSGRF
jgi:hypothetical protein